MDIKRFVSAHPIWVIVILSLLTRLPFLFHGYGVEEDSYGLVLTVQRIAETGVYEMSRAPGHPVQELMLSRIPNAPDFVMNGLSMLFGMLATIMFFMVMRELRYPKPLLAALLLMMMPVFYISSTYTIDYVWALAFLMCAWWLLLKHRYLLTGLALGLAVGCRVTSVLFVVPLVVYLFVNGGPRNAAKQLFLVGIPALIMTALLFLPALTVYGTGFFYTYPLPYPPLPKVFYKGTIGVMGVWGCVALAGALVTILFRGKKLQPAETDDSHRGVLLFAILMIAMHVLLYLRLPEKSAFLIPALPFLILLLHHYLVNEKSYAFWCALFLISPFFTSVQLADKDRGSVASPLAVNQVVAGQEVSLDFIYGPVISDLTKRINKEHFVSKFIDSYQKVNEKSVILCGFWMNHIELKMKQEKIDNPQVVLAPGMSAEEIARYQADSYKIFYLREQETYNRIKYQYFPDDEAVLFIE